MRSRPSSPSYRAACGTASATLTRKRWSASKLAASGGGAPIARGRSRSTWERRDPRRARFARFPDAPASNCQELSRRASFCDSLRSSMAGSGPIRIGVLASGRGSNFAALADAARAGRLGGEIAVLITDRAEAGAREEARRRAIPDVVLDPGPKRSRLTPEAERRAIGVLREHGARIVLLAGFMRMVHEDLLDAFPMAMLNIHPSLLPAFPGLDAPRQALAYGVTLTGSTVHLVDASLDGGPILAQAVVPVLPGDDEAALTQRIQTAEHRLYPETVRRFLETPPRVEGRRVIWPAAASSPASPPTSPPASAPASVQTPEARS